MNEKAYWMTNCVEKCIVSVDHEYYRPTEVQTLSGGATKAHKLLGWKPKLAIDQLFEEMVDSDMSLAQQEKTLRE